MCTLIPKNKSILVRHDMSALGTNTLILVGHKEVDMAGRKRRAPTVRWNHGSKDGLGERGQQGKDRVRFRPPASLRSASSFRDVFRPRRRRGGREGGRDLGRKAEGEARKRQRRRNDKSLERGSGDSGSGAARGTEEWKRGEAKGVITTKKSAATGAASTAVTQRYFPPS